jgi:hypothetical protein
LIQNQLGVNSSWLLVVCLKGTENEFNQNIRGRIFEIDKSAIFWLYSPMARSLRIEYPGAYYHVRNRGRHREDMIHLSGKIAIFQQASARQV